MAKAEIDYNAIDKLLKIEGKSFLIEIIEDFNEDTSVRINNIANNIANNHINDILIDAHTIKSTCMQIGAMQAAKYADDIEQKAEKVELEALKPILESLLKSFNNALVEINHYIEKL